MSLDKCGCQFCQDYARLQVVLPLVPEEHRNWVEGMCSAFWSADEELSYTTAILSGSWPNSVELLERALHRARAVRESKSGVN